ncbi:MAG: sigma-70 family RNA polymerase sigma factor [Bacteroidetes bacterium]|nr:sigma-70 family RNA polymerase sigma factor [Bacteroidota bacterium]MBS1610894.1 sigma-70 family RNA polymerase sigma factor [Bacteroidota bacterium]
MSFDQKPQSSADLDIISSLVHGGIDRKKAEESLFTRYAYFIEQAMHKYSFLEEDAFDIYSDTILSAIPKIIDQSFQGRSSLKTWLFQIFHNKCVDFIRKKTTNKNSVNKTIDIPGVLIQMPDAAKTIIQEMTEKTDRELIKQKLNELGENCKKILWQWAEGYSDKEIAAALEYKTADVVKTSRLRCLEKLRQLYKSVKE